MFHSWPREVYISPTPMITSSSTLLGMVPENMTLDGGSSYSASLTAPLPPSLAPGYYYVLVEVDSLYQLPDPNRANNILAATTGQLDLGLPALTLGTPYADSFTAADQNHYYQITAPAGGSLNVALRSSASSGAVIWPLYQPGEPCPRLTITSKRPRPPISRTRRRSCRRCSPRELTTSWPTAFPERPPRPASRSLSRRPPP